MDPAEIILKIERSIALQGSFGASLDEVWKFASETVSGPLDDPLKRAFWTWLLARPELIFTDAGYPLEMADLQAPIDQLAEKYSIRVYATLDEQYMALTGMPYENSPIGKNPFNMLCAIARARERGITTVQICQVTGQDSRSMSSRFNTLIDYGLIKRYPVVQGSNHTNIIVYKDYIEAHENRGSNSDDKDVVMHILQSGRQLLNFVKQQPNHIALYTEVYKELGLDSQKNGAKRLRALISRLEIWGCVSTIQVYEPSKPLIKFKCLKYLKELPDTEMQGQETANDNDDDDDDDDMDFHRSVDLSKVVVDESKQDIPSFNLVFPLELQVYDTVAFIGGLNGISSMDVVASVTGPKFSKQMSKIMSALLWPEADKNWMYLIRGWDFHGRKKHYVWFTKIAHSLKVDTPLDPDVSDFTTLKQSEESLSVLDHNNSSFLGSVCSIGIKDDKVYPVMHGDKFKGDILATSEQGKPKSRGRPRKSETAARPTAQNTRPAYLVATTPYHPRVWSGGTIINGSSQKPAIQWSKNTYEFKTEPVDDAQQLVRSIDSNERLTPPHSQPNVIKDLSFVGDRRKNAVLHILAQEGGVAEGGQSMCRKIDAFMESSNQTDRRTLKRVLDQLETDGKVGVTSSEVYGSKKPRDVVFDATIFTAESPEVLKCIYDASENARRTRLSMVPAKKELPAQSMNTQNITELFQNVETLPKRFRLLMDSRKTASRKPKARFGPKVSDLVPLAPAGTLPTTHHDAPSRPTVSETSTKGKSKKQSKKDNTTTEKPKKRKRALASEIESKKLVSIDDDLLFRAVLITRSLYGKHVGAIDWDIVVSSIPGLTPRRARLRWIQLRDSYGGGKAVLRAGHQWDNLFFKAYKEGKIKVQNPDDPDFDLRKYIRFWREHFDGNILTTPLWRHSHNKLLSRAEYEQTYGTIRQQGLQTPLDSIYSQLSMTKAEDILMCTSFSYDYESSPSDNVGHSFTHDELQVRSVVGVDDDKYNALDADQELQTIGNERVKTALEHLTAEKCLVYHRKDSEGHTIPGRHYQFPDKMIQNLTNLRQDARIFAQSQEFEKTLLANEKMNMPVGIRDNYMVSLLELLSIGVLKLERYNLRTGRLSSTYQSRSIDKEMFDFDLRVIRKQQIAPPVIQEVPLDEMYVWKFQQKFLGTEIWTKLAKKILLTIQLKPLISLLGISEAVQLGIDRQEISAVMRWLLNSGLVTECEKGYRVTPRWYHGFAQ